MKINRDLFDVIGLTLLDSIWQGMALVIICFLGLLFLKKSSARLRHNFLLVCLLALPVLSGYSFFHHSDVLSEQGAESLSSVPLSVPFSTLITKSNTISTESIPHTETFWLFKNADWIGMLWVIGSVLFLVRGVGGFLYLKRLQSRSHMITDSEIVTRFNSLREDFGIQTKVLLKESSRVMTPMVYGFFKPVILFPIGLTQGLSTDEVEIILLHELAHLKRNDFLINIIINCLKAVYFYNPAFLWIQSQLDNEREFATDEMVIEHRKDNILFIRALTKTQEFQMISPALGFAGNSKKQLLKRVNRIMKKQQNPNWLSPMITIFVLGAAFFLMSQAQTKERVKEDTPKPTISTDSLKVGSFRLITDSMVIDGHGKTLKFTADKVTFKKRNFNPLSLPQNNSNELQKAIAEIIEKPSPIEFEVDDSGKIKEIRRNGKKLNREEFKTYEKAYLQLQEFAMKFLDEEERTLDKERKKLLEQEAMVLKEELKRLEAELDSKDKQEVEMRREEINMRREVLKRLEEQDDLKDKQEVSIRLREEFNRYREILEDQSQLKRKEVLALQKRLAGMMDENELNELKSKIKTLEQMEAVYNSIRSNMSYLTITSDESRWTTSTKEKLESTTKNPLIILNGKSKSKWKLSDLYELDRKTVLELHLYNGEVMKKKYSKRKLKGRDAVIVVKTK